MSPLERRYRHLLWLLPADHRATRGEELLGLLLDLDDGRARPSLRQAGGVIALALRLRFVHIGSLLLAAALVAVGSSVVADLFTMVSGPGEYSSTGRIPVLVLILVPAAARLATAIAWILGARRTALTVYVGMVCASIVATGGLLRLDIPILLVLALAVWRRWPAPRALFLVSLPLAVALWWSTAAWGWPGVHSMVVDPRVIWPLAVVGAAVGVLLARRRSWAVRVTAGLAGGLAPAVTPALVYAEHGWLLPVVGVVVLVGIAGGGLRDRDHPGGTAVLPPARRSHRGTTE